MIDWIEYRCESCNGKGYHDPIIAARRVVKPERRCSECNGSGRVDHEQALGLAALDSIHSACLGVIIAEPRYSAQGRALGDIRMIALRGRLGAIVERKQRERGEL